MRLYNLLLSLDEYQILYLFDYETVEEIECKHAGKLLEDGIYNSYQIVKISVGDGELFIDIKKDW